ncbi:MAG: isopentenyl-diphosphate Delta-isomerase [Rickettsia endosymbiont of Bryobia graminum]|nr:isopentenyl-diphosphate Delta-isomerase [Rickettsia endosymbiont of Bryobia graminum]
MNSQHVVLVDENNNILGTEEKLKAHNSNTSLHRGFLVFLFNSKKELLVQKRIDSKITWGGGWSNSFCGHPQINETNEQAVHRHAKFELGISNLKQLDLISDNYRYKFSLNNIVENEICPIYFAISDDNIEINKQEVSRVKLLKCSEFSSYLEQNLNDFTPWCKEEIKILENSKIFKNFMDS